jgi:hypothetical protein
MTPVVEMLASFNARMKAGRGHAILPAYDLCRDSFYWLSPTQGIQSSHCCCAPVPQAHSVAVAKHPTVTHHLRGHHHTHLAPPQPASCQAPCWTCTAP